MRKNNSKSSKRARLVTFSPDDVIFPAGFRIWKNSGFSFLGNVAVSSLALQYVKLNLSVESNIFKIKICYTVHYRVNFYFNASIEKTNRMS